jgi:hypothetical protein
MIDSLTFFEGIKLIGIPSCDIGCSFMSFSLNGNTVAAELSFYLILGTALQKQKYLIMAVLI